MTIKLKLSLLMVSMILLLIRFTSINDSHRFTAITKASDKAVTEILSRMAVASFK